MVLLLLGDPDRAVKQVEVNTNCQISHPESV